jgi:hypothetical protein
VGVSVGLGGARYPSNLAIARSAVNQEEARKTAFSRTFSSGGPTNATEVLPI